MSSKLHGAPVPRTDCLAEPCAHQPERRRSSRALGLALAVTLAFAVVEAVGGVVSGSLALLADAGHMVTDAASLGLSLAATWIARRPRTAARTYGWYRVEILAALANGAFLLAVTGWIAVEAVQRMMAPEPVRAGVLLGVASLGLVANLFAVKMLHGAHHESLNVRGAYLHVLSDVLGSVGAILAGVIIMLTGWALADPLISIALSLLLLAGAVRLMRRTLDVLMEAAPRHLDVRAVEQAIAAVPSVEGVHDLHVWTVSDAMVAMSAHAAVRDPSRHQQVLEEITRRVRSFGIQHVTVQLERDPVCK